MGPKACFGAEIRRVPEVLELVVREGLQEVGPAKKALAERCFGEDPRDLS